MLPLKGNGRRRAAFARRRGWRSAAAAPGPTKTDQEDEMSVRYPEERLPDIRERAGRALILLQRLQQAQTSRQWSDFSQDEARRPPVDWPDLAGLIIEIGTIAGLQNCALTDPRRRAELITRYGAKWPGGPEPHFAASGKWARWLYGSRKSESDPELRRHAVCAECYEWAMLPD